MNSPVLIAKNATDAHFSYDPRPHLDALAGLGFDGVLQGFTEAISPFLAGLFLRMAEAAGLQASVVYIQEAGELQLPSRSSDGDVLLGPFGRLVEAQGDRMPFLHTLDEPRRHGLNPAGVEMVTAAVRRHSDSPVLVMYSGELARGFPFTAGQCQIAGAQLLPCQRDKNYNDVWLWEEYQDVLRRSQAAVHAVSPDLPLVFGIQARGRSGGHYRPPRAAEFQQQVEFALSLDPWGLFVDDYLPPFGRRGFYLAHEAAAEHREVVRGIKA